MSTVVSTLWDTPLDPPQTINTDFPVDDSILAEFPPGTRIVSANRFGASAWTATARLTIDTGQVMMEGEFNAMSELFKALPTFVPKPYAWGKYDGGDSETYFFLSEFIDMSDRVPEPNQLCRKLAQLHWDSVSPTGKFGFHVTTCQGKTPQNVQWETSWAVCFSNLLTHVLGLDKETNGTWEDLSILSQRILDFVIPRLIGALEKDGRTIKPCLIHADLWEGNTGTSFETGGDLYFRLGCLLRTQ
ncbi:uncharacterized protein ATNIH1004_009536 [Aspergillus tanneri]|uniref:protein-ribulosamine 3-kinase n=1 Tax=Aspergillus tanneri TaxID=1220188 RepID=A0A5M9MBX2_9EURO|nr:uncharacterized protein ATNIH1004_009536 [Aspergillus tanneri]KAA8642784.1 hypothetical protein ATNIH1004_009536 [Aspergillus tanneri]